MVRQGLIALALLLLAGGSAVAAESAVVLGYQRIGDAAMPNASVTASQFDSHISELKRGGYTVLPLPEVIEAFTAGRSLPDKTVVVTIDGARAGVYHYAWPRLKAAQLPFTVFVATDELDRDSAEVMTWDQLRELAGSGLVTIGTLGAAHPHFPTLRPDEIASDLARARARLTEELGQPPSLLAWPYGEANATAMAAARKAGFVAAFGQHSGAAWQKDGRFFLPRFPLNQTFGEAERFKMAVEALPLQAYDVSPADPVIVTNPPAFGFTLTDEGLSPALACYNTVEGRLMLERLGPRVEVRATKPLPPGRARLNCTVPSLDGRWRWFGWQFTAP